MIELWTNNGRRDYQRLYGNLPAALETARKELEEGNAVQIIPGREEPGPQGDPSWDE